MFAEVCKSRKTQSIRCRINLEEGFLIKLVIFRIRIIQVCFHFFLIEIKNNTIRFWCIEIDEFGDVLGGGNSRKRGRNSSSNQLIDQQQNVVSTGLRLSVSSQSSVVQSLLSDELASQIKHQRDEIDQFLQSQVFN